MRPLHLTLEGLACFKDKQELDLRSMELFAISGPTGAGKSTLLDAVTFALYGEVPRVTTQNRSEMISASRDRVSVRLDFEVGSNRYRIARMLRRSGGHQVRLEQHDGDDSTINLADQVRSASEKVVEILGLDAVAFMQAVVLPQGEFAKFLKAQPRERRQMLRSLLRLDVYERMREQAQRVASAKKVAVESARKVLVEEYAGLDEKSLKALEKRDKQLGKSLLQLRKEREVAQASLTKVRTHHGWSVELEKGEAELADLLSKAEEIAHLQTKVEAAARAAPLVSLLEEAERASAAAVAASARLADAEEQVRKAQVEHKEKRGVLKEAEKAAAEIPALRKKSAELNQILGRLPEAQRLKEAIRVQTKAVDSLQVEIDKLQETVRTALERQQTQAKAIARAQKALEQADYDSDFAAVIEDLREEATVLGATRRAAQDADVELQAKRKNLDDLRAGMAPLEQSAKTAVDKVEAAREALRDAETRLHEAHQAEATNRLRGALEPGRQCPVCEQAVESVPAIGRTPKTDAAERSVSEQEAGLKAAEADAQLAREALARAETAIATEEKNLTRASEQYEALKSQLIDAAERLRNALSGHMPPSDIDVEVWVTESVASLKEKRVAHEAATKAAAAAAHALSTARTEHASASDRLTEKGELLEGATADLEAKQQRLVELRKEIAAVVGSGDPVSEDAALTERIETLEATVKTASAKEVAAQSEVASATEALRLIAEAAKKADEDVSERVARRDSAIAEAGFAEESEVRASLLDEEPRSDAIERVRAHEKDVHAVQQRISALKESLGEARVTADELAAAEKIAIDLNEKVEAQHGEQKTIEDQLGAMKTRLERAQKKRADLASDERDLGIYSQLASDLRSDKFQAYVLEEAFTELVQGASTRLLSLTSDRYSLLFKEGDILVVDNDNAGETRISDTLSGGETFLTSLSLALELSDQVQRAAGAVNLDSLFIDEGFGTLDPDTLALVSETIQNLRVGGRMVGIITHIPELRDEFAQQIVVTKHQGYSTVDVRGVVEEAMSA